MNAIREEISHWPSHQNTARCRAGAGKVFVTGVDLGLTRDGSAVVTLCVDSDGSTKIHLVDHKLWTPIKGKKIDYIEVEKYILDLDRRFGIEAVGIDAWNAEHLAQTLEKADSEHRRRNARRITSMEPWVRSIPATAATLRQQAGLYVFFADRRLRLFECEPLRRDFTKLRVEERPSGSHHVAPRRRRPRRFLQRIRSGPSLGPRIRWNRRPWVDLCLRRLRRPSHSRLLQGPAGRI